MTRKVDIQGKGKTSDTDDKDHANAEATNTVRQNEHSCSLELPSPYPDFYDFEKLRDINMFSVGQIWPFTTTLMACQDFMLELNILMHPTSKLISLGWSTMQQVKKRRNGLMKNYLLLVVSFA